NDARPQLAGQFAPRAALELRGVLAVAGEVDGRPRGAAVVFAVLRRSFRRLATLTSLLGERLGRLLQRLSRVLHRALRLLRLAFAQPTLGVAPFILALLPLPSVPL